MADDDFFSDDDLDAIPDNTLRELESKAILASTQRSRVAGQVSRNVKPPDNVSVGNRNGPPKQNLAYRPPQPQPKPLVARRSAPPVSAPAPPSSDYGFDEGDVIDLDEPSMVIQPASRPPTRVSSQVKPTTATGARRYGSKALDPETEAIFATADAELGAHVPGHWTHAPHGQPQAGNGVDLSALQARVAELEAAQARLRQAEEEARNAAAVKQGEIAIVRANQEKTTKEYERRIAVMQKLHAEEAAKTRAELEAGRKEREKMETDNRFLQHDLAQEAERAKRLNGPGKARAAAAGKEQETPRKAKRTGLGDGFDDTEVLMISPSKSKDKAKENTPKHGIKRKRTPNDSPVVALSFTQPPEPVRQDSNAQPSASAEKIETTVPPADDRFEFMQRLLRHSPYEGHERTLEALAKHKMSVDTPQSLSTALMDELSRPTASDHPDYLPLKLARASLELWSRCLDAKLYAPLYLFIDLVNFALYFELSTIRAQVIEQAVPICVATISIVAAKNARASASPTFAASLDHETEEKLRDELCIDDVMDLLLRFCQASALCGDRIETFWRQVSLTFLLEMLNKAQPLGQIIITLQMLASSTLATTVGPISGNLEAQPAQEMAVVDRLTQVLFEIPEVPRDEPPYTETEIAELRLEVLRLLKAMCITDHGSLLMAQHRSAIGRLIRFLDGQVNKLCIIPSIESTEAETQTHNLIAQTLNLSTRIFYHLLRTHDDILDLTQKLSAVRGGNQKFWISMSRIAFSEQLVLESGIEDEVTELAHSILDNFLSPEEGDAMRAAVETPRGSKGSEFSRGGTTERDTMGEASPREGEGEVGDGDVGMSDLG